MKKTLVSIVLGLTLSSGAYADDLATVFELAKANDPLLNRAVAQKQAAFSGIDISRANLLPQLSASVGYNTRTNEFFRQSFIDESTIIEQTGDSDSDTFDFGINLTMSLYDHANWLGMDRAELVAQQSDANLGASLQNLMVRTVNAYLAVLREQDNVEFVKAELKAIERQLEQTKQRFEVGLTAITDVHEAQANFDNTVARQIRAENLLELRLEELREITGKYHSQISALDTQVFSATNPDPADVTSWLKLAEDKNLTLLAQRFERDIADQDIDIARSGHLPTLSLSGSYSENDNKNETTGSITNLTNGSSVPFEQTENPPRLGSSNIGIRLNVPLYEGGRVSAQTDRARANYVIASENLELTYRQTVRQIRSSYNDVKASISTIRALEQSVISAESALQATEAGFDVGTRTIVDVLNSTRNLFDARRNLADARYNFIVSIVSLKNAAGTLTQEDLLAINSVLKPTAS